MTVKRHDTDVPTTEHGTFYYFTRDRMHDGCSICIDGNCVQKVLYNDDWNGDVVIHGVKEDAS